VSPHSLSQVYTLHTIRSRKSILAVDSYSTATPGTLLFQVVAWACLLAMSLTACEGHYRISRDLTIARECR